jgi:hypothetical protein
VLPTAAPRILQTELQSLRRCISKLRVGFVACLTGISAQWKTAYARFVTDAQRRHVARLQTRALEDE